MKLLSPCYGDHQHHLPGVSRKAQGLGGVPGQRVSAPSVAKRFVAEKPPSAEDPRVALVSMAGDPAPTRSGKGVRPLDALTATDANPYD